MRGRHYAPKATAWQSQSPSMTKPPDSQADEAKNKMVKETD